MSVTSGFFDSLNGDRKYNSLQLSSIFDGIISDGVYATYGEHFLVEPVSGMTVKVGSGRAWLDHTWTLNDVAYPLIVSTAEVVLQRVDTVIIEVDRSNAGRSNTIKIVKGTPASEPVGPTLATTGDIKQYPLADILVKPNVSEITAADITNRIGTTALPWVTGIIDYLDASDLMTQWTAQANKLIEQLEASISQAASSSLIDGSVTTPKMANKAVTNEKLAADAVKLTFTDTVVQTSQWAGDTTYEDFPFRALIGLSDAVTAAMVPEVIFNAPEAASGIFAPVAQSTGGGIMLYASEIPSAAITIPTIILWR